MPAGWCEQRHRAKFASELSGGAANVVPRTASCNISSEPPHRFAKYSLLAQQKQRCCRPIRTCRRAIYSVLILVEAPTPHMTKPNIHTRRQLGHRHCKTWAPTTQSDTHRWLSKSSIAGLCRQGCGIDCSHMHSICTCCNRGSEA